jgi:hypothetical protein
MSLINRLTSWAYNQTILPADLNAEFNNIINLLNNLDAGTTPWDNVVTTNLTVNGTSIVPGAKIDLVASATASNSATIAFNPLTLSNYNSLIVVGSNVIPATNAVTLVLQMAVSGTIQVAGYTHQQWRFVSGGSAASGSTSATAIAINSTGDTLANVANQGANFSGINFTMTIYNPSGASSASCNCTWTASALCSAPETIVGGGTYNAASNINGFQFSMTSGNIASGKIYLYGLRNS